MENYETSVSTNANITQNQSTMNVTPVPAFEKRNVNEIVLPNDSPVQGWIPRDAVTTGLATESLLDYRSFQKLTYYVVGLIRKERSLLTDKARRGESNNRLFKFARQVLPIIWGERYIVDGKFEVGQFSFFFNIIKKLVKILMLKRNQLPRSRIQRFEHVSFWAESCESRAFNDAAGNSKSNHDRVTYKYLDPAYQVDCRVFIEINDEANAPLSRNPKRKRDYDLNNPAAATVPSIRGVAANAGYASLTAPVNMRSVTANTGYTTTTTALNIHPVSPNAAYTGATTPANTPPGATNAGYATAILPANKPPATANANPAPHPNTDPNIDPQRNAKRARLVSSTPQLGLRHGRAPVNEVSSTTDTNMSPNLPIACVGNDHGIPVSNTNWHQTVVHDTNDHQLYIFGANGPNSHQYQPFNFDFSYESEFDRFVHHRSLPANMSEVIWFFSTSAKSLVNEW